jgi:hypothetical protein
MVRRNTILLVEQLNVINCLYVFCYGRSFQKIMYVSQSVLIEKLQNIVGRIFIVRNLHIEKLHYADLSGSDFDVREETYLHSDELFDRYRNNIFNRLCVEFCKIQLFEVAVRKEFLLRYTTPRIKVYIFLYYLTRRYEKLTFIPVDNEDISSILSSEFRVTKPYSIPGFIRIKNGISTKIINYTSFLAIPIIACMTALFVFKRGIVLSKPKKIRFDFGLDIQSSGLIGDRGLHSEGNFFLYDDNEFHPSKILHVIDGKIKDNTARASLEKFGAPYQELGTLKVPLSFAGKRMFLDFIVINSCRAIKWIFSTNKNSSFLIPSFIVMKMTMDAEINSEYLDIEVFISRDDFSTVHIVRTLVAHEHNNRTVGFQFADYSDHDLLSHIMYDKYALWGEFYRKFHEKALQYSGTEVIGANLYGSDEIFRLINSGYLPQKYTPIKKCHRIVAIMSTSFDPEIFLTKEITMEFYKTVLDITNNYPDVFRIIKTKRSECLTPKVRNLIKNYENVLIEEELSTYNFLSVPDLLICIWATSIGIESIMAGKKVVFYDRTNNWRHPYAQYSPYLVAVNQFELEKNLKKILRDNEYIDSPILERIKEYHGYKFDGKVTERFKMMCLKLLESTKRDVN